MKKDRSDVNDGKIGHKLEKDLTNTDINKIKRDLKMNSMELGTALGWLARENKITFFPDEKTIYVFPVE